MVSAKSILGLAFGVAAVFYLFAVEFNNPLGPAYVRAYLVVGGLGGTVGFVVCRSFQSGLWPVAFGYVAPYLLYGVFLASANDWRSLGWPVCVPTAIAAATVLAGGGFGEAFRSQTRYR